MEENWLRHSSIVPSLTFPCLQVPASSILCVWEGMCGLHLSCAYERRCAPFTFLGLVTYFINAFLIKY